MILWYGIKNIDLVQKHVPCYCRSNSHGENVLFCGSPSVGKTNFEVSIGIEAAKKRYCVYFKTFQDLISQLKKASAENRLEARFKWFCRYKLLIIDELGYQRMDVDSANLFFNLIAK